MFEFSDLNMQVMPDDWQAQWCPGFTYPCICLSRPPTLCRCVTQQVTCRCLTSPITACECLSKPVTFCRCLTRPTTLPCICLSKPIASVPPRTLKDFTIYEQVTVATRQVVDVSELDVLRTELQEAMKHVEIQREVMARTTGPQSEQAFDEAESALKQQLEELQRQRRDYRNKGGGETGGE